MAQDRHESKLDELQQSLYDKKKSVPTSARRMIHEKNFDVPESWNESPDEVSQEEGVHTKSRITPFIFLLFSIAVCIIAGISAWLILRGTSQNVSAKLITLEAGAPEFVDGGETFDYTVRVVNQNKEQLELVNVDISYPQGIELDNVSYVTATRDIGTVLPNTIIEESFPLTLYGTPGTTKPITTRLRYTVPGSTATFEKEITEIIEIKSSPVALTLETVDQATSAQTIEVKLRIEATRGKTIPDTTLKLIYPTGFEFVRADVPPTSGTTMWSLGTLTPGVAKEITIIGVPRGEDGEQRTIRAQVGTKKQGRDSELEALFVESESRYVLTKPFLATAIVVNNSRSPVYNVSSNSDVSVLVEYTNTTDRALQNVELSLSLSGDAVDKDSVRVQDGFYDSRRNKVTWTKSDVQKFASLEPGGSGSVRLSLRTKPPSVLNANQEVVLETSAQARRVGETNTIDSIEASQRTVLRIGTSVALMAESIRSGAFATFGPMPPLADQETSYIIQSRIQNSVNPIEQSEVTFTLPANVRYVASSATYGTVTYSDFDRQVKWNTGTIVRSGTSNDPTLQVHVAVTPSLDAVGSTPTLARNFRLTALDTFTKSRIQVSGPASVTTKFRESDGYRRGDEIVGR